MQTELKIGGMSCEHCVKHVKKALEDIKGVKKASVSLAPGLAVVEHSDKVAAAALETAVRDAGYDILQ